MASEDELVTREHSRQYVAGLSSCFMECGVDEKHIVSFEAEYTYPDGSKDTLLVGRSCRGFCLSRSTFLQSVLGIRRGRFLRAYRMWKNTVTILRHRSTSNLASRRKSSKLLSLLARSVRNRGNLGFRPTPTLPNAQRIIANGQVFEIFKKQYSPFFGDYSHNLILRERISGGMQGEIRAATWRCNNGCECDVVVKVFNDQFSLQDLSPGMLDRMVELEYDSFGLHNLCLIFRVTLLRSGRLAMVMRRYSGNLRKLIELKMQGSVHNEGPPFLDHEAKHLMQDIAKGMHILHSNGILHRDLNPSNVLILKSGREDHPLRCYVADFEFSRNVVGTGFFRSPEVLQGVKMKDKAETMSSYQKHSDVYSFGMTCYEICTGRIPLRKEVKLTDYDFVLEGRRPNFPDYVDPEVRALMQRCWHLDPSNRPTFGGIVKEFDHMLRS